MMRILVIVLALAGCGSDENVADMALPECPANAGQSHGARCRPGVDTLCTCGPNCYMAHCQCDGWWETDAIAVCCDADGGTSRCSP
jgi:hypothetical protein